MRRVLILLAAALLPAATGCEWLKNAGGAAKDRPLASGPVEPKSAAQLVGYLNQQAALVQSLKFAPVSISVKTDRESHTLGASTLVCEQPRNFALDGDKAVLSDIVKLGSNGQEFWMYSKFPQPTYLYCSHDDFARGAGNKLPVPFDPDWVMQALGMAHYDPNRTYQVETDNKAREHSLSYETTTPQGATVRRVVVFAADGQDRTDPQIRRHLIEDTSRQVIAVAEVKAVSRHTVRDAATGQDKAVAVPSRIKLDYPRERFTMDLTLGRPQSVNDPITDAERRELFTKPDMGVAPINLATGTVRFGPSSARGVAPGDALPPRRGRR